MVDPFIIGCLYGNSFPDHLGMRPSHILCMSHNYHHETYSAGKWWHSSMISCLLILCTALLFGQLEGNAYLIHFLVFSPCNYYCNYPIFNNYIIITYCTVASDLAGPRTLVDRAVVVSFSCNFYCSLLPSSFLLPPFLPPFLTSLPPSLPSSPPSPPSPPLPPSQW